MASNRSTFVRRLCELSNITGVSLTELAQRSGVSRQALSLLEQGKQEPSWELVRRLAKALGVSVAAFDGRTRSGSDQQAAPARLLDAARAYARAYDRVERQTHGEGDKSVQLFAQFQEAQVELNLAALDLFAEPFEKKSRAKPAPKRRRPAK
jgi:transcriptional regulator with XRE-family HTH domain